LPTASLALSTGQTGCFRVWAYDSVCAGFLLVEIQILD
jgi:hypothetical protein